MRATGDWARFVALSALCDRLAQATFVEPMEGYVRRMLWAAAAEGALPRGGVRRPLGARAARAGAGGRGRRSVARCARGSRVTSSASARAPARFRRAHPRGLSASTSTARYLGFPLPHPIGKGSGQLSLNQEQLETDRAAGLAFVVLKTVIAEDAAGDRAMGAWAIHETRMKVERSVRPPGARGGR